MPPFFCQPFFQQLHISRLFLHHQFRRQIRCTCIELFDKAGQDLALGLLSCQSQEEVISADQSAITHKEYLHDCILQILRHCHNISVIPGRIRNLLLLRDFLYTLQEIPVFNRPFIFHCLRRLFHLTLQVSQDQIIIAVQKLQHLIDGFPVFLLIHISLTRRTTLMNMIIQAWSLQPDITRKSPIAATDLIQFPDQLNRISHRSYTGIRSKVLRLILLHLSCHHDPRKWLLHRHFNKWITLVIHQHSIIFRSVLLDQITLQHQSFQLRICDDIFKSGNMRYHLFNLRPFIPAGLKILPHPVLQTDCFTHIDNLVFLTMHQIYARFSRKLFQFFLYIKHLSASLSPLHILYSTSSSHILKREKANAFSPYTFYLILHRLMASQSQSSLPVHLLSLSPLLPDLPQLLSHVPVLLSYQYALPSSSAHPDQCLPLHGKSS